ncbi:MAG: four helix bundle protein [Patescibacteria group bacterium]|jgi:four helix bundle protein
MKIEKFEDIIAWQKSKELAINIYSISNSWRDFSFRDQIRRASVSSMNNIAEGFERKGNKEFGKFLYIAKGSCAEVRSMLYLALELNYIDKNLFDEFHRETIDICRILSALIKAIKN